MAGKLGRADRQLSGDRSQKLPFGPVAVTTALHPIAVIPEDELSSNIGRWITSAMIADLAEP